MEFSIGSVPGGPERSVRVRRLLARSPERPIPQGRLMSDVFAVFPEGILVVSATGRILTWNPALAEIVGRSLEPGARCCAIFGCRTPGTALEDICLRELAMVRGQGFDEIVIELPGTGAKTRVAITATPFHGSRDGTVVFQVRRATEPVATAPPEPGPIAPSAESDGEIIRVRTLGDIVVETPTGELHGDWLDQRTGRLLKFLVANRDTPMHSDAIAEALWPRARPDTTNTVRHFIHALREKLEPRRRRYERSAFVLARNGGYQLNRERVKVDADEFEREARAGLIALAADEPDIAVPRLEAAMALYKGDFLPDERYEDWAINERERLRDLACKPLRALAELTDDPDAAAFHLERLAEMEPLDVDVHRELIGVWMSQGRRSRAMRHYRAVQSRLMRELGERVTFDLTELGRQAPRR
jgi:DNA-binding SARP family transcriptional activator